MSLNRFLSTARPQTRRRRSERKVAVNHTAVQYVMKEVSRKFSADDSESPNSSGRLISQPQRDGRPAFLDLRFVVKESLNLGFRWFDEVDKMIQKFKEDDKDKKSEPENKEGDEHESEPS